MIQDPAPGSEQEPGGHANEPALVEFFLSLNRKGIKLWLEDQRLKYSAAPGTLTEEFRAEVNARKVELMNFLQQAQSDPADQAQEIASLPALLPVHRPINLTDTQTQTFPLSSAQQRLWFFYRLQPESPVYNVPLAFKLTGELNPELLERALREIEKRHETLRTNFMPGANGMPVQNIQPILRIQLRQEDISNISSDDRENAAKNILTQEARRPFRLESDVLWRALLVKLSAQEYAFQITLHHIITDGWSEGVLFREISSLYRSYFLGAPPLLDSLPVQYVDYAAWQADLLQGASLDESLRYWKQELAGELPIVQLPLDYARPAVQSYRGALYSFNLPPELHQALTAFNQAEGVSLYMTLLAAFTTLLHRYTSQTDLLVGTPSANRNRPELENLIGFFVNTLVIRADLMGDPTFRQHLRRVRQQIFQALHHQELPFDRLVEELRPERGISAAPIFQVMFVLQNATSGSLDMPDIDSQPWTIDPGAAKFDLALSITEIGAKQSAASARMGSASLECVFEYNTDLFDQTSIERIAGHFQILLESAISHPELALSTLSLLTSSERQKILYEWNQTARPYPQNLRIHQLFENTALRYPDKPAILFGRSDKPESWSYSTLNQRANQIAHLLRTLGAGPESLVGICHERSPLAIAAILGILKAGGAFLPLDPSYPKDRLDFMLQDSRPAMVLTQEIFLDRLATLGAQSICLDRDSALLASQLSTNPENRTTPENLAYVIYTSGSTGHPKGVEVTHRGIPNLVHVEMLDMGVDEHCRILQFASSSFDASVFEIFVTLAAGASLVVVSQEDLMPGPPLRQTLQAFKVTNVTLPPSVLAVLNEQDYPDIHTVVSAGEACPVEIIERWAPGRRFFNAYGPTEFTVCATFQETNGSNWSDAPRSPAESPAASPQVTIGRPIANARAYILGPSLQPLPVKVPGELYLGGEGLARGYLNRPQITATRFILDPFRTRENEASSAPARMYRTGDLACYLPDGRIEFLGRLDQQVKLRGFRIELEEIQNLLNQHPLVNESLVMLREDQPGQKRLVAYITHARQHAGDHPSLPSAATSTQLLAYLKQKLPEYMAPSAIIVLESFPLSPNGKIDRSSLPVPESTLPADVIQQPPTSELERSIARIWQDVLHPQDPILETAFNRTDNFFDLGGHSLLTIQVLDELEKAHPGLVNLIDLFQYPTIQSLAQVIQSRRAPAIDELPAASYEWLTDPHLPTSPEQTTQEIAVIGLSCRFPGAEDAQKFWANLQEGKESIRFFSRQELLESGVDPVIIDDPNYVSAKGYLEDAELFDAAFFAYSPGEAETIDPQQRLFLEEAWKALEIAGYASSESPLAAGVFAGSSANGYFQHNILPSLDLAGPATAYQVTIGSDKDFLATRVAYKLNLTGPSVTVQSACSTSLVAVHLACQSLRNGECDLALAGGVSLSMPRQAGYLFEEGMILSPDGHCRAFDAQARGVVPGEGVGIVVLKRMQDAHADSDTILAVIKGSAINNDGAIKVGFTAPGVDGQASVIAQALKTARISPDQISYIETHGTGTPLGDPIEIHALTQAFQQSALASGLDQLRHGFCAIGSVKTNIGHLDAASGIAGLIKTILALQHAQIPPSLNYDTPNPQISFSHTPFYVNSKLSFWAVPQAGRRFAGVSSFGIGGANAHVILGEAPGTAETLEPGHFSRRPALLTLSARTPAGLQDFASRLSAHLRQQQDIDLSEVSYTLQTGRKHFRYRRALICSTPAQAAEYLAHADPAQAWIGESHSDAGVAFLFPGQGAQYVNMALGLYQNEPVFRHTLDRCCELLLPLLQLDLRSILYPELAGSNQRSLEQASLLLQQTAWSQPAIFVTEYALAQLWLSLGILPVAMAGHSIGEYVAACLSGVFSLEDALTLVAERGRLMQSLRSGAMIAVPLPEGRLLDLLGPDLSLAAVNAPDLCVASGPRQAIDRLEALLSSQGMETVRLHTSHAFHSAMMEPILDEYEAILKRVTMHPPRLGWISTVTGTWADAQECTLPAYWIRNLRQPVRFSDAASLLLAEPHCALLEVGPGRTLTSLARRQPDGERERLVLSSLRHPQETANDQETLMAALSRLWLAGTEIDWNGFWQSLQPQSASNPDATPEPGELSRMKATPRKIALPTYPFERKRFWITPPDAHHARPKHALHQNNRTTRLPLERWFYLPTWTRLPAPASPQPASQEPEHPSSPLWLLFTPLEPDSGSATGTGLQRRLINARHPVVTVSPGIDFIRSGEMDYRLDPAVPQQYHELFNDLHARNLIPSEIVHLWSLALPVASGRLPLALEPKPDESLLVGFDSLLYLAQAAGRSPHPARITVVSCGLQDVSGRELLCPQQAGLLSLIRVIPQEAPLLRTRSIDIDPESSLDNTRLDEKLFNELHATGQPVSIAYRGGHRWGLSYSPLSLPETSGAGSCLRKEGVYLITGGLGGLGLALAEHLAHSWNAKLALVGLNDLPPRPEWQTWIDGHPEDNPTTRILRKITSLDNSGAQILIQSTDISSQANLEAVIQAVESRFGALNGIFHLAGVTGEAALHDLVEPVRLADEPQYRAKILSTFTLARVLQGRSLDFVVLYSSISTLLGGLRMNVYAACNQGMEAIAQIQNRSSSYPWFCLSWDRWAPALPGSAGSSAGATLADLAINKDEGMQALERILLQKEAVQIIISTTDLHRRLEQWVNLPPVQASDSLAQSTDQPPLEPESTTPISSDPLENRLAQLWSEILGVKQPGLTADFFELGGHSLLAVRLATRIHQEFGLQLPISSMLEGATIQAMAQHLRRLMDNQELRHPASLLVQLKRGRASPVVQNPARLTPDEPGVATPLTLIHPVGGNILCYNELARLLGEERSIYGIQSPGITNSPQPATIEELAALYLKLIRDLQVRGPYEIGGWSMGAAVAYEMARQITQRGDEVSRLIMIDPWTPPPDKSNGASANLSSVHLWLEFYRDLSGVSLENQDEIIHHLATRLPEAQTEFMLQLAIHQGLLSDETILSRLFHAFSANAAALARYQPGEYAGRVLLIQAERRPAAAPTPSEAWKRLLTGAIRVIELPGDHSSLLTQPAVKLLAACINEGLRSG